MNKRARALYGKFTKRELAEMVAEREEELTMQENHTHRATEELASFTQVHVGLVERMRKEIEELRATGFTLCDALKWTWRKNDFLRHEMRTSDAERDRTRSKIVKEADDVLASPDASNLTDGVSMANVKWEKVES